MPAVSKSQQRLFAMVHAYQQGTLNTSTINSKLLSKVKKIAGNTKKKDAKKFANTKHEGLPTVKEQFTFLQFLIELTQKEKQALIPPISIQKLYADIKRKSGVVKRQAFFDEAVSRFKLTPDGLQRIAKLPSVQLLLFDGDQKSKSVGRSDPWVHVSQKATMRKLG